jgi:hypothetical protein
MSVFFRNHSDMVGHPVEITRAKHLASKFVGLAVQAQAAAKQEMADQQSMLGEGGYRADGRSKRNIFGSILSGLTGLVTDDQMAAERERQTALEKKLMHAMEHEVIYCTIFLKKE